MAIGGIGTGLCARCADLLQHRGLPVGGQQGGGLRLLHGQGLCVERDEAAGVGPFNLGGNAIVLIKPMRGVAGGQAVQCVVLVIVLKRGGDFFMVNAESVVGYALSIHTHSGGVSWQK